MYRDGERRTFTFLSLEIPSACGTPKFHQGAAGARAGATCGVWPRLKKTEFDSVNDLTLTYSPPLGGSSTNPSHSLSGVPIEINQEPWRSDAAVP
jgi:hypothetical protein